MKHNKNMPQSPVPSQKPTGKPTPSLIKNEQRSTDTPHVSRWVLTRWMLRVTKPVLGALVTSTLCRIFDQVLVIGIYVYAVYQTLTIAMLASYGQIPSWQKIWTILIVMVGMSLVKGLLRYGEQFFGHFVAFKALELLRREVYENLVPQAPAVMNESDSGDLLSRITSDIDRIEVFFAHTIAPAISAIVVPAGLVAVLAWTTTPLVTLMSGSVLLLALVIIPTIGNGEGMRSATRVANAKGQVMQEVSDSIQGIEEVVGYGAVRARLDSMAQAEKQVQANGRGYRILLASRRALSQLFMLCVTVGVFVVGLPAVADPRGVTVWSGYVPNVLSIAGLGAAAMAVLRCWEVIRGVEGFATYLANSFAAAGRIYQIAHTSPAVESGSVELRVDPEKAAGSLMVSWRDVTFRYPEVRGRSSDRLAVDNVSLNVSAGAWVCIVGATGSGKSTLISLLERYWDPDSGQILVAGRPVGDYQIDSLRRQIAVVSQRTHIFAGSIAHNLRLAAPDATDEQLMDALRYACLDSVVCQLPDGIDTVIGSGGAGLSGGQIQRLSLARAYLMDVHIFVLDEFTAHLDPELAVEVRRRLRELKPYATVIEVTHGLEMVENADWVAVIDAGHLIEQNRPEVLLADPRSALSHLVSRL
ncbi:MAG: ABC transporter ATP-binding protein [Actinomycetaceae bacterium]|nr:ABC transporter ATP-binding protein [Actinomycetaceae bacterium]